MASKAVIYFLDFVICSLVLLWCSGLLFSADVRLGIGVALGLLLLTVNINRSHHSLVLNQISKFIRKMNSSLSLRYQVFFVGAALCTLLCITKVFAGRYVMNDQGIFNQLLWSIGHGFGFEGSAEEQGNHLYVHFSPTVALLVPFQFLFSFHPLGLVLLDNFCVWFGAFAWLKTVETYPDIEETTRNRIQSGLVLLCVFFNPFWANVHWGFYEAHLGFLFLSWGYYFFVKDQFYTSLLFFALTGCTKELFLIDIALLMIAIAISEKAMTRRIVCCVLALIGVSGFQYYQHWNAPHIAELAKIYPEVGIFNFFKFFFSYLGADDVKGLLIEGIKHPVIVFLRWWEHAGRAGAWMIPVHLLSLVGFGAIIFKSKFRIFSIALIPSFAAALLVPTPDFGTHYTMILWPTLVLVSIEPWGKTFFKIPNFLLCVAVVLSFLSGGGDYLKLFKSYAKDIVIRHELLDAEKKIPEQDSVSSFDIGTQLSQRRYVNVHPYSLVFPDRCADWVIVPQSVEEETLLMLAKRCPTLIYQRAWVLAESVALKKQK